MTMLERVAKAIYEKESLSTGQNYPAWKTVYQSDCKRWFGMARAALTAMREPTSEMMEKYLELDPMDDDSPYNPPAAKVAWQAMIDAALNEKP